MVDPQPFKQALLNIIKRWSFMFKEHLISHVTTSLNDLQEFIKVTSAGFNVEVEEGDYDGLVGVMGHLLAVRDRQATTGRHVRRATHLLAHTLTHSITHSHTHTHSLTHSHTLSHSYTHSHTHSYTYSLTHSFTHLPNHLPTKSLTRLLHLFLRWNV